ncbi:flippase [uncultured Marivirga sp.]|uniref:flippase n=2 Tax=Marivirga TaxID=869806 RepID=UPI0030EDE88B|tara:strand:+ start:26545 stop:27864 length:1320 start_codon:yes stop_codon:yes gene_type:complete
MPKKQSYWIQSGKFTLLERFSVLIFGVFTFILLVRILGKEQYGAWMLFISLATLLETARNGFFKNPLIRFSNTENETEKSLIQSTSLVLNILFSIGISIILAIIANPLAEAWQAPELVELLYIFIPTSIILALFFHFDYIQRANFQFFGPFLGYFFKNGLLFSVVLFHFIFEYQITLFQLGVWYGASALTGTLVSFIASKSKISFQMNKKWTKALFSYGKYTLGTNLSAVLMRNIDIWMIGWYLTPAAVAVYNVAIRIANLFEVPSMALASILFPEAVRRAEADGDSAMKSLYEKSVAVILLFSVPFAIFVIIFSNEIIALLAGSEYSEAGIILNITMLYGLLIPFNKQMGVVLDAVGKAKKNMFFVMRNAIINTILNIMLIPYLGVMGAALATLSCMIIVLLLNQIYLHKNYKISLKNIARHFGDYGQKAFKRVLKLQ